jgi:predicted nucleic acid-binding protein
MDFMAGAGLTILFLDDVTLGRAFELMVQYADTRMDLAEASLVVAAEQSDMRKIFTIDRADFAAYRIKRGHVHHAFETLG